MIGDFKDQDTRRLFEGAREAAFEGIADRTARRLTLLDGAAALEDLGGMPSNRLEALRGARTGQYGLRINDRWRICFRWEAERPCEVELVEEGGT